MTTITPFVPGIGGTFNFEPTLDGNVCSAVVWYNASAQRWFISVAGPDGSQLFNKPLIGSASSVSLQSLAWQAGVVSAATAAGHGHRKYSTVKLSIAGCSPSGYNGTFECFIKNETTFTYLLQQNPGPEAEPEQVNGMSPANLLGAASFDINIGAGYLAESTLVYREAARAFEVSP